MGRSRAELLTRREWASRRDTLCEELALDPNLATIIDQLTASLDAAWRRTAAGYAANSGLRIEHRGGRDEIVLTPLDAEAEPASLVTLSTEVEKLLPEVEIADLPLEVHGWTGFLDEYTHISGTELTREEGLIETLSALLVSESCNVGLTPVADPAYPSLTRERLNWVGHNYLRSATHAAANARLVDYHTPLPLAQAWGTPTTRPIAASSTTCSAAGNAATPSPGMSSTASAARSGGTTRSGRKTSSTASAS